MFEVLTIDQKGKEWLWNVIERQEYQKEIDDVYTTRVEIEQQNIRRWNLKAKESIKVVLRLAGVKLKETTINSKGEIENEKH